MEVGPPFSEAEYAELAQRYLSTGGREPSAAERATIRLPGFVGTEAAKARIDRLMARPGAAERVAGIRSEMAKTTWFTSDWHFNHARIIELCNRPFATVEEMNETIIANHNSLVRPGDDVYVLGDVALGTIREFPALVQRMNGRKYLIPGNHDRCWTGHKRVRGVDTELYINAGFEILSGVTWFSSMGWVLCHFPAKGDSLAEDRYLEWRPTVKPTDWLIHGHVHEKWQVNGRQINVGVDAWDFKPVSAAEIQQIIDESQAPYVEDPM